MNIFKRMWKAWNEEMAETRKLREDVTKKVIDKVKETATSKEAKQSKDSK